MHQPNLVVQLTNLKSDIQSKNKAATINNNPNKLNPNLIIANYVISKIKEN